MTKLSIKRKPTGHYAPPVYTLPAKMPKHYHGPKGSTLPKLPHLDRLAEMFTYKRPYNGGEGVGYKAFTEAFIMPLARECPHWVDDKGNVWVDLRESPKNRTLFTAHTDSVHRDEGRQHVAFDAKSGDITVLDGSCLGADDAAGVAMLLHLIEHEVPAMYVFTVGEEVGGVGAGFVAQEYANLLMDFDRAIAFDRRADWSVITHQGWGRCCSEAFAEALAEQLSNDWLMYAPDDTGVYTDTAEFTDLIAECTNISIGYDHEHTTKEKQNLYHFQRLADAVLGVAWDDLPVVREPGDSDWPESYASRWGTPYGSTYTPPAPLEETDPWWAFEEEAEEALGEALAGDPDELIYLAAVHYCETHNEPVMDTYQRMSAMPITMSMVQEADDDMYTCGAYIMLERLAQRLLPN